MAQQNATLPQDQKNPIPYKCGHKCGERSGTMNWWELGEHSGYSGNSPISRITCAFCKVEGNFSVIHHEYRKQPNNPKKVLQYDTIKCGNCGNLMMLFWTRAAASMGHGLFDFRTVPWNTE